MGRYFFHIEDGGVTPDEVGSEHANFKAARTAAVRLLAEALPVMEAHLWADGRLAVAVCDETGLKLLQVETFFVEAPALGPRRPS